MVAHILRGVQLLFALIVLGLAAGAVDLISVEDPGSRASFLIFCAVWSFLAILYIMLAPRFVPAAAHKFSLLAADALTMIFWFAGFIPMADIAKDVGDYKGYSVFSVFDKWHKIAVAATVFAAFEFLLFLATTILNALAAFRSSSSTPNVGAQPEVQSTPVV
jgi:hypothetical protein